MIDDLYVIKRKSDGFYLMAGGFYWTNLLEASMIFYSKYKAQNYIDTYNLDGKIINTSEIS